MFMGNDGHGRPDSFLFLLFSCSSSSKAFLPLFLSFFFLKTFDRCWALYH